MVLTLSKHEDYFLEYIATTELHYYHSKSPWIEIPRSFHKQGWKAFIACHYIDDSLNLEFSSIKLSKTAKHKSLIREFFRLVSIINTIKPQVFLQVQVRNPTFILAMMQKLRNNILRAPNSKWCLKLDWDGSTETKDKIATLFRNLLISINSWFFDSIIVESTCGDKVVKSLPLINKRKVRVIPNGFPDDVYKILSPRDMSKKDVILCVSRYNPIKSIDILITAFTNAVRDCPTWELKLVGHTEDKDYFGKLQMMARELEGKISFIRDASESDLASLYATSKIFCLPSKKEGFNNARIEAICNGLAVITTTSGCGMDIDPSGEYIVPVGDAGALERKLRVLMGNEEERINVWERESKILTPYSHIYKMILSDFN